MNWRKLGVALAGTCALALAGCAGNTTEGAPNSPGDRGTLTVFAAASLGPAFTELAEQFEASHPDTKVVLNFAGSQTLQEQIVEGAPADVFASADRTQMEPVVNAGLAAEEPIIFATNTLTMVTPPGNPEQIHTFADLARQDIPIVVCAPEVPCGAATKRIEEATGITLSPVSEEQSVTDVLGKVQADEADAGLVYKTDAISAGNTVERIDFEESKNAVNEYPIAMITGTAVQQLAQQWVDLVLSENGQATLRHAGFGS